MLFRSLPRYQPTLYEWLREKGSLVNRSSFSEDLDLYEVPEGFSLFMVSAQVAGTGDGAGGVFDESCYIKSSAINQVIVAISGKGSEKWSQANSVSFPIPLRFNSGDKIELVESVNCDGLASFTGFIVRNQDIPFL